MEPLTEIPDLGTVAGISTGVLLLVSGAKQAWPGLKGSRTFLLALGLGVGLALWWEIMCQGARTPEAIGTAAVTGLFGGTIAAGVARAVRSPTRKA